MLATMAEGNLIIEHPNRDRPESQATRVLVVGLLLVSTAIFAIATVGGWEKIQGAKPVHVAYVIVYLLLAFYIARWRSGLLPVAASSRSSCSSSARSAGRSGSRATATGSPIRCCHRASSGC